jgi:acetoin utilization deacetylase AcuC-like enzyme
VPHPPLWLSHPSSLAHVIPGHPERPERLVRLEQALDGNGWFGWEREQSPPATRAQLAAVHTEALIDMVESLCAAGGGHVDHDTAAVAATWPAALHAAGGAVRLAEALLAGEARAGFSAHRPPGHHAEPGQAMGFCFFDSVAVAAARALETVPRVLILDWDVHHGNGTNEIFRTSRDVLFVSIHQSPLYPGTGPASDVGSGAGEGFTINLPVPPGSGDETFCSLVEHVVAPLALAFEPGLVLVSAGFDAHVRDPLASCRVTEAGFAAMTGALRRACAELGVPLGMVLEGGYSVDALADSVCALLPVLGAVDPPAATGLPRHALAEQAIARLGRWWPALA